MIKQDPWFIEERAFAFVSLLLTKRNDAAVRPYAERDLGIDLLVEILKDGKATMRFFGVQVIASMDLPAIADVSERILSHLGRAPYDAGLPLCAFAIGVRKPEGIYSWVVAPVVENGQALLHRDGEANWQTLNEAGAACLIDKVNAWYDALNGEPPMKSRNRHSKTKS